MLLLVAQLSLGWYDSTPLCDVMARAVREEVTAIMARIGVSASWDGEPESLRVVLVDVEPETWRLKPTTLGAVMADDGQPNTAFVFTRRVFQLLGHRPVKGHGCPAPRPMTQVSRGLAKIVAHELVHAVAPDHPHADEGLMAEHVGPRRLLERRSPLDAACVRAFRRKLAERRSLSIF